LGPDGKVHFTDIHTDLGGVESFCIDLVKNPKKKIETQPVHEGSGDEDEDEDENEDENADADADTDADADADADEDEDEDFEKYALDYEGLVNPKVLAQKKGY
jgi:hypothetical protein